MKSRPKAMGLALVAVLALSAVVVSVAQATFYYNAEHTILSGGQTTSHVFRATTGFGGVSCSSVEFSGTATGEEASTQVITPKYSGCSDTFGRTVDIDNSSLTYEFTTGGEVKVTGSISLTITNGSKTVICTATVSGPQTDNGITYSNLGGTSGVNSTSGGLLNCGVTNGSHSNGSYEGKTVVTGQDTESNAVEIGVGAPGENVALSLSGPTPTFHVNEEKTLTATNTGNVKWSLTSESFQFEETSWDLNSGEVCHPTSREPTESCTVKVKCTAARTLHWTVKVESANHVSRKKTLDVDCDDP
jgi:hypothetical protein